MRYDRTIIGYHGCDAAVAERLLDGEAWLPSENDYDWLGRGIYFWEHGEDRALRFARQQKARGKLQIPAVVAAVIQLGDCFDLLDTRFVHDLARAYAPFVAGLQAEGKPLPQNAGATPDEKLRRLDCALINWYLARLDQLNQRYDTVRGGFVEGGPAFPGAGLQKETHVQIAVRNPRCILLVGRP